MASLPLAFGATGGETGSETPAYRVVARRYRPQRFDEPFIFNNSCHAQLFINKVI